MEIVTGVHQLRIPFPEGIDRHTNAYVVEGNRGSILVDCGWDSSEAIWAFREELRVERLSFEEINWVVVTHVHPDHFGLAAKLRELCGAKIVMHRADAELIQSRYVDYQGLIDSTGAMLQAAGVPEHEVCELRDASVWTAQFVTAIEPDVLVDDGDTVSNGTFQLEVMHTPGHTPGHICLYDPRKRRLFSGDTVLFETIPHVGLNPQSGTDPISDYMQSLEYLGQKSVSFVFPGHGPVFNSLVIRTEEILRTLGAREHQVLEVLEEGLKTVYEVTCELPWRSNGAETSYADMSPRERRAAVLEIAAWISHLKEDGKVAPLQKSGQTVYMVK
ncbi:MAG: MBL fold metallo-hydrolase [Dehalococcoidia bacterium]|nr:MBL fold metallo-hydrolase [Dehalococcoidia bacterium]